MAWNLIIVNVLSNLDYNLGKRWQQSLSLAFLLGLMTFLSVANAIQVTVSIPPLAGLVQPLLGEKDSVKAVLKAGATPHGFQLKPSHLMQLQQSDLVLWSGTPIDSWMQKPLKSLVVKQLSFAELPFIQKWPIRKGGVWLGAHEHHSDEYGGNEHSVDKDGHKEKMLHADHEDSHEHESGHEHEQRKHHADRSLELESEMSFDGHLWLSIENSQLFVKAVSVQLQQLKPLEKNKIQQRTQAWLKTLSQLDKDVSLLLKPVQNQPFLVLHDAFQYFEKHYQLNGIGSIQINPSIAPSLQRVYELREKVKSGGAVCVFKEPQFPERRIAVITRNLNVKTGSLDPMGLVSKDSAEFGRGFMAYDSFYKQLAQQFYSCLSVKTL